MSGDFSMRRGDMRAEGGRVVEVAKSHLQSGERSEVAPNQPECYEQT